MGAGGTDRLFVCTYWLYPFSLQYIVTCMEWSYWCYAFGLKCILRMTNYTEWQITYFILYSGFLSIHTDPLWQNTDPIQTQIQWKYRPFTDRPSKKYRPFELYIFRIGLRLIRMCFKQLAIDQNGMAQIIFACIHGHCQILVKSKNNIIILLKLTTINRSFSKIPILQTFCRKYRPLTDPKVQKGLYYTT